MSQADAYRMIRRRSADAAIFTKIGNHSFRATCITEYLRNGGKLEIAQQMAAHESARTTGLYDRRNDQVSLDEIRTNPLRGNKTAFSMKAVLNCSSNQDHNNEAHEKIFQYIRTAGGVPVCASHMGNGSQS